MYSKMQPIYRMEDGAVLQYVFCLNLNSKQPGINRQLFSHTRQNDFKQKEINKANNVNNLNKSFSSTIRINYIIDQVGQMFCC